MLTKRITHDQNASPVAAACCGGRTYDEDDGDQQEAVKGCMAKVVSSARNTAQAVGKRLPCPSFPTNQCSKAQRTERVVPACQAYGIDTVKVAPLAFTYSHGEGVVSVVKVFQSL
jgi:hypothetical protein